MGVRIRICTYTTQDISQLLLPAAMEATMEMNFSLAHSLAPLAESIKIPPDFTLCSFLILSLLLLPYKQQLSLSLSFSLTPSRLKRCKMQEVNAVLRMRGKKEKRKKKLYLLNWLQKSAFLKFQNLFSKFIVLSYASIVLILTAQFLHIVYLDTLR